MQTQCASSGTHRSTEWEVWLLWWTTLFVWNLPPLSVCVSTGTSLLACLAPQKGSWQSFRAMGVEFIAPFVFAWVAMPCSLQPRALLLFQAHWELTSWDRGGWTGWLRGQRVWHPAGMGDHQLCWGLVLAIWKSVTKSRSHHLGNGRTKRDAQPWAWCFILCQRELLVSWNLVRWLLQQDYGKLGWYCFKMSAFFRQRIFFQWQSKGVTLNKPLT